MHRITIFQTVEDKVVVSGSEFISAQNLDEDGGHVALPQVELIPSFPTNWPSLQPPNPPDEQSKNETRIACNKLLDSANVQAYYEHLWGTLQEQSKGEELDESIRTWVKNYHTRQQVEVKTESLPLLIFCSIS
jgi:hypothetical protein